MVSASRPHDPALLRLLAGHPRVELRDKAAPNGTNLEFWVGDWRREIEVGAFRQECYGLPEIEDNNPWVCADRVGVPGPGATLALLAVAPIALAGLVAEPPSLLFASPVPTSDLAPALARLGVPEPDVDFESQDLGSVLSMVAMVVIETPGRPSEIADAYEERYGRSFFVRAATSAEWSIGLVAGQPGAAYRLSLNLDEDRSLLSVYVVADREGKAGAAQVVHAMNVMAGFEESLGLA